MKEDSLAAKAISKESDEQTGYVTKSILCTPIKTVKNEIIGVAQILNKKNGQFNEEDMTLLNAMTAQAAVILQSTQFVERMQKSHATEMEFVDVVSDMISEIDLDSLLEKVRIIRRCKLSIGKDSVAPQKTYPFVSFSLEYNGGTPFTLAQAP